ncbi:MAG: flagellar motor protein [Nitrospirae bacterium]|nr:MAG: flagellar motor protein [Nitrospirota bacterium]
MNLSSLIGLLLGISAVVVGTLLEGGRLSFILQPAAAAIVLGGTLGATLLSHSFQDINRAVLGLRDVFFKNHDTDLHGLIGKITSFSALTRRKGLVALEREIDSLKDPFFRKALRLAIDGLEKRQLRDTMEEEIITCEDIRRRQSLVYETAGGYAPTIGIIGAVIGLIHVMQNLSEPSRLGEGIAIAFVSTVYGVGLANLVLLPISKKLREYRERELQSRRLILEGVMGIQSGIHPEFLKERLLSFIERNPG